MYITQLVSHTTRHCGKQKGSLGIVLCNFKVVVWLRDENPPAAGVGSKEIRQRQQRLQHIILPNGSHGKMLLHAKRAGSAEMRREIYVCVLVVANGPKRLFELCAFPCREHLVRSAVRVS